MSQLVVRSFSWAVAGPGAKKDGFFRRRFNPAFDRLLPFFPSSSFSKVACQTRVEANWFVNCKQSLFFSKIGREKQGKEGLKTTWVSMSVRMWYAKPPAVSSAGIGRRAKNLSTPARMSLALSRSLSLRVFEQKKDWSQSNSYDVKPRTSLQLISEGFSSRMDYQFQLYLNWNGGW